MQAVQIGGVRVGIRGETGLRRRGGETEGERRKEVTEGWREGTTDGEGREQAFAAFFSAWAAP